MTPEIKNLIDPNLFEDFLAAAEKDIILQGALKKSDTAPEFINSLIAALILILHREQTNLDVISEMIKNNPVLQKALEYKNDPSLLSKQPPR